MSSSRLCWATDIHLDAAGDAAYQVFLERVRALRPDLVLITGDLDDGRTLISGLQRLSEDLPAPLVFILGNHDYYGRSIASARAAAADFEGATYLTAHGSPIPLGSRTALIGHDGWADGQAGDFLNSPIGLRDYHEIADLKDLTALDRLETLRQLGAEAAAVLGERLRAALVDFDRVVVAIHAPPFREACLYGGMVSHEHWAPHFVAQQCGEALMEVMREHPKKELLVLCGHSHHAADYQALDNLRVLVGHAEYGEPLPQQIFVFDEPDN